MFNLRNAMAAALVLGLVCALGGVAEAFIVSNIPGNELWLDATDTSTLFTDTGMTTNVSSAGNPVRAWADKSGNANHAITPDSAAGSYQTSVIGGQDVVRFNRGDLKITGGLNVALNQDRTAFVVMDYSVSTNNSEIFGTSTGNMVDVGQWSQSWRLRLRQGNNTFSGNNTLPAGSHLLAILGDTNGSFAWREGTQIINSTNQHFHWAMNPDLYVGGANFGGREYIGDLAEVIVFDRQLTDWETNKVGYYLAEKYGFQTPYIVPEPSTLLVWSLFIGLGVGAAWRRRRRR